MDRLVAARKASEPTVAYTPPAEGRIGRRRWLVLGALALLALIGLGVLAKVLFFSAPRATAGAGESLLGVRSGDGEDEVMERLRLAHSHHGKPFNARTVPGLVGKLPQRDSL